MSDRQRVAVIGVGHLGRIHARILARQPRAELVCVVDADEARAHKVAGEVGCRALGGIEDLPPDLDAAIVAVPTSFHEVVAVPLLERGIACLVEKPLAADLASADRILRAAEESGACLAPVTSSASSPACARWPSSASARASSSVIACRPSASAVSTWAWCTT
jgi:predicted dehydrogenase